MIDGSAVYRILVIKLRAIGDVLLSTVVLDNLHRAFPGATIDFLTERLSREVIEGNPHIDSLIVFDPREQSGISLIRDIRRRGYDLVIDLFGNPRSALVTAFSGARFRLGYHFGWRRYCYNIVAEPRGGQVHNTEFNLDALRALDIPVKNSGPVFPISDEADLFAEEFFFSKNLYGSFVVALNPGGGWYTKRWRASSYTELGKRIAQQHNAVLLLLWGPGEREDAEILSRGIGESAVMLPRTSLKQLGAILKRCDALVTNDSGPMHIAAAVGTPVLAIFGPTDPKLQGPAGAGHEIVTHDRLDCLACNLTQCPIGNPCMMELTVDSVENAFHRLVSNNPHIQHDSTKKISCQ